VNAAMRMKEAIVRRRCWYSLLVRILVLNQYFRPDQAASAQRITDLAEDLSAHHEVTVLAGRPSYSAAPELSGPTDKRPSTLRVHYVPSTTFVRYRTWKRVLNYVSYLTSSLIVGLMQPRHDVLVVASDPPLLSLIGLWLSRVHRAPFVHLMWDVQPEVAVSAGLLRYGWLSRMMSSLNRHAIRCADLVIVPTTAIGRTAVELGVPADRVHTLSHWEDLDVVRVGEKDNPFSREHHLVDRFVVMYAGNLGLTQELDRYLDLAVRLRDLDDLVLVFVGDGAVKSALQARRAELALTNVQLLPYAPRERMGDSLASADVFLAPVAAGLTRFMLPSKIYTYMAAGRPIIAALDESSDLCDLVRAHQCGFAVAPTDIDAIEAHVRWLHAHREPCREMGERARRASETCYARSVVTPQFVELLRRYEPARDAAVQPTP